MTERGTEPDDRVIAMRGPSHYQVRIGGKDMGIEASTGRQALIAGLMHLTDDEFAQLAVRTESGRITASVTEAP